MRRIPALGAFVLAALPSVALAAEGHSEGLINLDKGLIIQVVNFILLMIVLTKLLYRPLLAKMDERTQAIKKSLEEAQAVRAEAQKERAEHAAKIQAAHAEAQAIRASALKEAADEQRRLLETAREEADRLVAGAKAELAQDVRRAREDLRREVGDMAVQVAERLIRKSLRDEDHRRIVDDAIARLGQQN
jgi:F-type H+-transporting ATPase subunit b